MFKVIDMCGNVDVAYGTFIDEDGNIQFILCDIDGEFMSHINFDGTCYWKFGEKPFPPIKRDTFTLPSDSGYREDLILFKDNELGLSQKFKLYMEENQRRDNILRSSNKK